MATCFSILAWENPVERGDWSSTVPWGHKSWIWLSDGTHTHIYFIHRSNSGIAFQSLRGVQLLATPWTAACQPSLSQSLLLLISIEAVMSCSHLIHCHSLLLIPLILPSIRVFSNELALRVRWPKYWSSSFSISPSNEYSGLISFRIDWFDLLAVWVSIVYTHHSPNSSPPFPSWHPCIWSVIIFWSCLVKVKMKVFQLWLTLCDRMNYSPWNSPGYNTGEGSISLLQGIFPTQELIRGLLHCRQILYQLSYQRSPEVIYSWYNLSPFPSKSDFLVYTNAASCFIAGPPYSGPVINAVKKIIKVFLMSSNFTQIIWPNLFWWLRESLPNILYTCLKCLSIFHFILFNFNPTNKMLSYFILPQQIKAVSIAHEMCKYLLHVSFPLVFWL